MSKSKTLYVFRGGETGLFAVTNDPAGHNLPSRLYPQIRWQFERRVMLQAHTHSPKAAIATAVLDAIAEHGFYLTHSAIGTGLEFGVAALVRRHAPRHSDLPTHRGLGRISFHD